MEASYIMDNINELTGNIFCCNKKDYISENGFLDGSGNIFILVDMSKPNRSNYAGCNGLLSELTVPSGRYIVIKSFNYYNMSTKFGNSFNKIILDGVSKGTSINIFGILEDRRLMENLCSTISGYFECDGDVIIKSVCYQPDSKEAHVCEDCITAIRIGDYQK